MERELLFFLGAGASVPAGVPDTVQFVRQFEQDCAPDTDASTTLRAVLEILEE